MRTLRAASTLFLAAGLFLSLTNPAHAIKILMHGRNAAPSHGDDLTTFNYLVSVYGEDNVDFMEGLIAAADGSSAIGYDVVYISSSMASSNTRGKYEDSPVGIVCDE